jgi:alpha-L-rhamnosidase
MTSLRANWPTGAWRGRWIWDPAVMPAERGGGGRAPNGHSVYLRRAFSVSDMPDSVIARVVCDSRYALYVNGELLGRGPVRSLPEFLYWDEYDLAPHLRPGGNVIVALCLFLVWRERELFGATLGSGSFCLETTPDDGVDLCTDSSWSAVPTPWVSAGLREELVDGARAPIGLHDPEAPSDGWPSAIVATGESWEQAGRYPDRPPAPPYVVPIARGIPPLTARHVEPTAIARTGVRIMSKDSALDSWRTVEVAVDAARWATVWDLGSLTVGYVNLAVRAQASHAGETVHLIAGETLRADGLPELEPLKWGMRYRIAGRQDEAICFLRPIGLRYLATVAPADVELHVAIDESIFPRPEGATFHCDDERLDRIWAIGTRTVDCCATDAFVDGNREDQAWVGDAGVAIPVHLVTSPDVSLVRRTLELAAQNRRRDGLLPASVPDETSTANTIPDFSLHWIRSLTRYWEHTGDEAFLRSAMPVAEGIVERYESYRGSSGLLEDVPGWVFIDWAQIDRDSVTGAHDALYAAALRDYGTLPGATPVDDMLAGIARAFDALWDDERSIYVDALGPRGRSRRMSQQTNGAALLAGLVPAERVDAVVERIMRPEALGGRLVPAGIVGDEPDWQLQRPPDFHDAVDVLAAQPFFAHFVHAGLHRHGRTDLVVQSLLRWADPDWMWSENGTFAELADWKPGLSDADTCHGWSATPTCDLTTYVLGLSPAEPRGPPGRLDPYLGPLAWVSGTVPTPHGWISARIDPETVDLTIPPGVEVLFGDETVPAGRRRLEVVR